MIRTASLPLKLICFSIVALATTAVAAAPINTLTPSPECLSAAGVQRTLDHAQCTALPIQLRDQCIIKAEQTYATAVATCAGAKPTVTRKQNLDAPFSRRLRF